MDHVQADFLLSTEGEEQGRTGGQAGSHSFNTGLSTGFPIFLAEGSHDTEGAPINCKP